MSKLEILRKIEKSGMIAVIRLKGNENFDRIINCLADSGVHAIEITMTTPNAVELIREYSKKYSGEFIFGSGTVLDTETATKVINAGAEFVVSPILDLDIIKKTNEFDKPIFPGAYTPTEIFTAWNNGADIVKVFPATTLGPGFLKDIHGPLPAIKLTPTGGVSLENAAEFMRAGAVCLGVGTALLDKKMIANEQWKALSEHAKKFKAEVERGRKGMPANF